MPLCPPDPFEEPLFACSTSGEYAMLEAAAAIGAGNRDAMLVNSLIAFMRAGRSGILTCHALKIASMLN